MRKTIILFSLILLTNALLATITVDGNAFLENQTDHSNIKILFEAVTPSATTDSTLTNSDGSFSITLSEGVYNIQYSHEGWYSQNIEDVVLFVSTTLENITLLKVEIEVSGEQSGLWEGFNKYKIVDDVVINLGDTLTIEPGVIVMFMEDKALSVYGKLVATGSVNDTIVFTSAQDPSSYGDWEHIKFFYESDSSSIISFSKIEYSSYGIICHYSAPTISNCTFYNNWINGMTINGPYNVLVQNNKFIYNGTNGGHGGISCSDASEATINDNLFLNCQQAIRCMSSSNPVITNNEFIDNVTGINFQAGTTGSVYNNNLSENHTAIVCNNSSPNILNCTIINNYYGFELWQGAYPLIDSCFISKNTIGIINRYSCNPIIQNCVIDSNSTGIESEYSSSPVINNNIISNHTGIAIKSDDSFSILNKNLIIKNIKAIELSNNSFNEIINTDICDNQIGIDILDNSDVNLKNSIIYNNDIGIQANSTIQSIDYSAFWQNTINVTENGIPLYFALLITVNANSDSCDTYNNIFTNPLFVDDLTNDYHLQSVSPCIDAGDPNSQNDPDGTITDMGAYYFDQSGIIYPSEAEFTSDIAEGVSPLTINFTDLSTQGTGIIDQWDWDFGDEGSSSVQNPIYEYQNPGIYSVTLTVTDVNDSTDTETKIDYITVWGNDPPAPPTNVQVNIVQPDAVVSWSVVDTTIFGNPITPDGYVINYNETANVEDEYFYFLAFTTNTVYTHEFVAQHSSQMFYRVVAFVDLSRNQIEYLENVNVSLVKIKWSEVKQNLNKIQK